MSIPKVIHFAWFSNDQKPDSILDCIQSWRRNCPDYEIIEWGLDNHPFTQYPWFQEAIIAKKWAFATDLFRLWVLKEHGGIYLDSDIYLNSTLDPFLSHRFFIGIEKWFYLGPHAMGAIPNHSIVEKMLEYYRTNHFLRADGSYSMKAMPKIITPIFEKITGFKVKGRLISNSEFTIYPANYLTVNTLDGKNFGEHRMSGSWIEGRKINLRSRFLENQMVNQSLLDDLTDFRHQGNSPIVSILGTVAKTLRMFLPYILLAYIMVNFRKSERFERAY